MALEADRYFDRRRLKRRLSLWRVIAVVAVVAVAIIAFGRFGGGEQGNSIATLDVTSIIFDDPRRNDALRKLAKNSRVKALIVRINSPGGTVVGGESLYFGLRGVAAEKPVVAVMGEVATSAGYMAAIGADYIVGRRSTITGSIGVLMQTTEITGLLAKLGIKAESIKSTPLKAQPNPFEPMSPAARAAAQNIISDIYAMFVDLVTERRKMERSTVLEIADGRVYTGRQALNNGLIDAVGDMETARQWLADSRDIAKSLPLRPLKIKRDRDSLLERISDLFGITLFSERLRLDGVISLWQPALR